MTDDLRARIAAVAEDHDVEQEGVNYWQCTCGEKFYINQGEYRSWQEHLADAVIRELGLKQTVATEDRGGSERKVARYVTEWRKQE